MRQATRPTPGPLRLDLLPPRLRRTCALAWHDRAAYARIASVQGISVKGVVMRVHRARLLLAAAGVPAPDGRRRPGAVVPHQLSRIENV